jgi:hypothetical protein
LDLDCVMANLGNNCLASGSGVNCPTPTYLANPTVLPSGHFEFIFAGAPVTFYQVLATTNLSLASSNWTLMVAPVETSSGQFQFIDSQAADRPALFYRVQTP